jgi:uncharacterized repeat protein (TIGR01451 family)
LVAIDVSSNLSMNSRAFSFFRNPETVPHLRVWFRFLLTLTGTGLISLAHAQTPSFSLSLSSDTVGVGSCLELTFEINNESQVPVDQLAFRLGLPEGVALTNSAFVFNDCGGVFEAPEGENTIILSEGAVAANSTCTATVGLILSAAGPFTLTTGDLTSSAGNSGSAAATLATPVDGPSLGFSKMFAPSLVQLGGQTTLTYTIQNQSSMAALDVSFTDDLSPGIVVANVPNLMNGCADSSFTAIAGSQQLELSGGTLEAGGTCTISLEVVGVSAGMNASISDVITSNFQGGPSVASGQSCAVLGVIPPEDLANITFSKTFLEESVAPGGQGLLEFTVTNNSRSETFSGISFRDDLNAMLPGVVAVDLPQEGGFFVDGDFNGTGSSLLNPTWDYLDQIQNENGRNEGYPLDGNGNEWNESDFNTVTSTVGPWSSGDAPLQAGLVDAFPAGTPELLGGIDAAANGENLVTTYLFRQNFDLSQAQAGITDWLVDYVFDDGAIIYVNGVEVFRTPSMPAGAVTTTTLSELGDETGRSSRPVSLAGLLVSGRNTVAVELHQTTLTSSDAGFDLELLPASVSPTAGFRYADDTFEGTNDAGFADGSLDQAGGFSGGGLNVTVGGKSIFSFFNPASSGGWSRTFTVEDAGVIPVSFRYRLLFDGSYEDNYFSRALFEVDGVRYGNGPNTSLAEFEGGTGFDQDTGWRTFSTNIFLGVGDHTILLGVFNDRSLQGDEVTQVWFDDVQIGSPQRSAEVCGSGSQIVGSDVLEFTGGQLGPGQSCSFQVGVQVPLSTQAGSYRNTTSVISTDVGQRTLVGFPATDTLIVAAIPPGFSASFSPIDIGIAGTTTLTFIIDNRESLLEARDASFSNTLPPELVISGFPEASSTCGGVISAVPGEGTIGFTGGVIPSGEICAVSVNVTSGALGDLLNTSEVLNSSLGESGFATANLTVNPAPGFSMSFGPDSINAGQVSTLFFTIDNSLSGIAANDLGFTHKLPAGLVMVNPSNASSTCEGGTLTALAGSDTISYNGGTVPAGAVCSVSVGVTSIEGGSFPNTSGDLISSLGNSGNASDSIEVEALVSVDLSMSASSDTVVAGSGDDNLTYVVTARNNGPSTATGINIVQGLRLPAGVQVGEITASAGEYYQANFGDGTWLIPTLLSGASATLSMNFTVGRNTVPGVRVISNFAIRVAVDQPVLASSVLDAGISTAVVSEVDIALGRVESIDPVLASSGPANLVYTVTATNTGPSDASNVTILEALNLPAGVVVDSIVPDVGTFAPGNGAGGLWSLNLPRGEVATLIITLSVTADAPDASTVTSVTSLESVLGTDTNASNNSVTEETTVIAGVDLVVSTAVSDEVVVAGSAIRNLTYTVEVTNNGPLEATAVELTGDLVFGNGVEVDSVTPSVGTYSDPVWSIESLAVGATETLTIVLTVGPSAEVASPGFEGTFAVTALEQGQISTGDESDSAASAITREVDLSIFLDESRDPVLAGFNLPQNLFHTITVTNNGPSDASGVEVDLAQVLPAGVLIESISPALGTSLTDAVWTVGDLGSGDSTFVIYYYSVPVSVAGGIDVIASRALVSGVNELLLNDGDDLGEVATSVVSPSKTALGTGAIELDFQTGLFKQVVTVTNTNPIGIPAFRILVSGLPEGVTVHNAQGVAGGNSYLLYNRELGIGESVELVVEYFQADASGGFEPTFELELLDAIDDSEVGEGVAVDRCEVLPNGDVLVEFAAEIGGIYTVQYSEDGESWLNVIPDVVSGGTKFQWVDNGPPKTASHPAGAKRRFYRLFQKVTAQ